MNNLLSQKHRFEVLDIFRGIFASLVFLFHLCAFSETPILNNSFIENSDMFVDFFFVLSGFVIGYSYQNISDSQTAKLFLIKRFYRIYPLHFFMLMLFVVVEFSKTILSPYIKVNNLNNPDNNLTTFFTSLFLINSTPVPGVKDVSWNIPSWSISAEMCAYLVFGVLVWLINSSRQTKNRNLYYGLTVCISLGALWLVSHSFKLHFTYDFGFIRGILGFFVGVLCFNLFNTSHTSVRQFPTFIFSIAEILILGLITTCIAAGELLKELGFVYEILFFCCIYIFAFEKGIFSSGMKKIGFLHQLGKYSYSIYMTHALFISLFNVLFIRILKFPPSAYSYLFILNFIIIFFASVWTYKNIEMRFMYKKKETEKSAVPN